MSLSDKWQKVLMITTMVMFSDKIVDDAVVIIPMVIHLDERVM